MRDPRARRSNAAVVDNLEWAFVALLLVAILAAAAIGDRPVEFDGNVTRTVTVSAGDTLWEIAKEHPVPGLDTAETVELIASMNDVDGGELGIGSHLMVPAGDDLPSAVALR